MLFSIKKHFLTFTFLFSISLSTLADDCLTLHVIDNPPSGFKNNLGELSGIHFDFLMALEKQSGLCINKKLLPYPRALKSIQVGEHDGGILPKSTTEDPFVKEVARVITLKMVVIPRKGITINRYEELKSLSIGKIRGSKLSDKFDNDPNLNIIEVLSYKQAIKMLKKGRVDAIVGSSLGLSIISENDDIDYFNLSGKLTIGQKELWLMLSKRSIKLEQIPLLHQATLDLNQAGTINKIMEKYYGDSWLLIN